MPSRFTTISSVAGFMFKYILEHTGTKRLLAITCGKIIVNMSRNTDYINKTTAYKISHNIYCVLGVTNYRLLLIHLDEEHLPNE